ncbi:hypothetical protein BD413DRAFT_5316 [Trametes elegans]|nr:hypothetical protein BD413DRAFT_5316 [Trametes elegans]
MKRSAEAGPSTNTKRARVDSGTVAEAFKPDQRRKAAKLCRKGTDGTGYIEGKVFERGAPSGDIWEFSLTVELGSRVLVLLSGTCSQHFSELPLAVGAQVRIATRGLHFEEHEERPRPLQLPKKFAWREGATIYVRNPKTGEESFVNTWAGISSDAAVEIAPGFSGSGESETASVHTVPTQRRSSPGSNPSADENTYVGREPPHLSDTKHIAEYAPTESADAPLDADPVSGAEAPGPESSKEQEKTNGSQSDSQNPQSLPSPPPELSEQHEALRQGTRSPSPHIPAQERHSPAKPTNDIEESGVVQKPTTTEPSEPEPGLPRKELDGPKHAQKRDRKPTKKGRRRLQQLAKAGKLDNRPPGTTSVTNSRATSADDDGEEHYWDAADAIPDDLLFDDTGQLQGLQDSEPARNLGPMQQDDDGTRGVEAANGPESVATHVQQDPATVQIHTVPQPVPQINAKPEPLEENRAEQTVDPVEALKQGCVTGFVEYIPLIQFHGAGSRNIMGVVESCKAVSITKHSEYMLRLTLYDPTNYGTSGLSVTLFDKTDMGLPAVDAGDILMLRAVQMDNFHRSCALGPSFKGWQWAVFHVKTGMMSSAPVDTCALRHFKPDENEVQFSIRLGDWWRDVSANVASFDVSRRVREHKLIADAGNEEYFDCTIEVLHGLRNENGVHSVFVTDYTRNPAVSPTQGEWCPPRIAPYVLRVEMWDTSANVAPTMQPGEYYSIRNLRTRVSGGGYLEGKMQEGHKITKLDEDQLENQPHLAELLRRKAEWEVEINATGGVHEFPHQLIAKAEENRHFCATVQVVHLSPKDDYTYLYVTDYTARTDIVPVSASIAPPTFADRVLRVELKDAQVDIAKMLMAGDYVVLRNLRLRPSGGSNLLSGRLGGDQRLITKLNPKANGNAELRALLSRKEEWAAAQSKSKREGKRTATRAARHAAAATTAAGEASTSAITPAPQKGKYKQKGRRFTTLEELKASSVCPAVFRVRARVVDFFPDDLRDCTVLRCTSCDKTLPKTRRRCTKCDDAMDDETAVEAFFQLWFRIADEEGTTLDVSVADERCSILRDLSPDEVHEDEDDAFAMFVARVKPLLGALLVLKDGEARRRPVEQDEDSEDAPILELTIGSWLPEGEPDSPDARAYVVLKHTFADDDA